MADTPDSDSEMLGPPGTGSTKSRPFSREPQVTLELAMAQMETRLRAAVTELVHPTVQKMTSLTSEVETLKALTGRHARDVDSLQLGQLRSQEQVGTVAQMKEEMARWDSQRRISEASIDEKLEAMTQKVEGLRFAMEQKESALHHLNRSLDRVAGEVNRILEDQEGALNVSELRIDELSKRIAQQRAELDVRFASVDQRHNALSDELWGDELGLAKMAGELKKTNATFGKLEDAVESLQEGKAEAVQLDKLRADVAKMVHEANTSTTQMRQAVGEVVNDVREHFRTASQTISSHNANFVKQVREEYQAELSNSAKLRDEVKLIMDRTSQSVDGLELRVDEVGSKANALAAEAREEIEELNRRRKRDKTSADNELKALKKRLGGVFDNSDAVLRGIEHIYSVLQPVLESELMQCALEKQDSIDRDRISLMGVKDDETSLARTTHAEPQRPRPECRVKSAPGGMKPSKMEGGQGSQTRTGGFGAQKPVVRVDTRCVSCSGQAPLVLAAFKMACLHYAPSPVEHAGMLNDRQDLLDRREQLLQTANRALLQGPIAPGAGETTVSGGAGGPSDSFGNEDRGDRSDVFSGYASIEVRQQQNRTPRGMPAGAGVRLPNVGGGTGMTPRMVSVQ